MSSDLLDAVNEGAAQATEQQAEAPKAEVKEAAAVVEESTENAAPANDFLSTISEEYRQSANIADFKDINELAKSYVEQSKLVGNSVRIPGEDASEESRQEFLAKIKGIPGVLINDDENKGSIYDALGRPEKPENYNFTDIVPEDLHAQRPEFLPEIDQFRNQAHELGLSQQQAAALMAAEVAKKQAAHEAAMKAYESGDSKLKEVWGDDHNNRREIATKVARIMAEKHPAEMKNLIEGEAGRNPMVAIMLAELGEVYAEKGHVGMQQAKFGTTPEQAMAKIAELRYDKGFQNALRDNLDPAHKEAVAKWTDLYASAYPEES
jgi:hypothetical protein